MSDKEITLYKFTNQKESPYLDSLLAMFYSGAFRNAIGIMEASREFEDGKGYPALILVGVAEEVFRFPSIVHCLVACEGLEPPPG